MLVAKGGAVQKNTSLIKMTILQTLLVKDAMKRTQSIVPKSWLTTSQCIFFQEKYDHKKLFASEYGIKIPH